MRRKLTNPPSAGFKQLTLHVEAGVIRTIKERAINLNITMKNWLLQAIAEKIEREERAQ